MLEWTICTKCGKVLDNSKMTCPNCNSKTEKLGVDYLKSHLSGVLFLIRTLDIDLLKDHCPKISQQNAPLEVVVLDDLFRYFSFLGLGDGVITDNELNFINELLISYYTKDDIMKLADAEIDEMPASFECLHELDLFARQFDMTGVRSCNELFDSYRFLGNFFLTVDGELNPEVYEKYCDYIDRLENRLGDYLIEDDGAECRIPKGLDAPSEEESHSLEEYLDELNKLIGLEKVKKDVNSLINLVQIRKLREERRDLEVLKARNAPEEEIAKNGRLTGGANLATLRARLNGYPLVNDQLSGTSFGTAYEAIFVDGMSRETIFELFYGNDRYSLRDNSQQPVNTAIESYFGNQRTPKGQLKPSDKMTEDVKNLYDLFGRQVFFRVFNMRFLVFFQYLMHDCS